MLAILIFGLSNAVSASPSSPARNGAEHANDARPALHQADVPTSLPFKVLEVPVQDASLSSRTVCTIRVMRADPSIDRDMVKAMERRVDPEMVVPSVCAR